MYLRKAVYGEYFSDPEIRNCHLTFYSSDFDIENDLIVLQLYTDWIDTESKVFKSKNLKNKVFSRTT